MPWQQTRLGMSKFVIWCSHYYSCTIIIYCHKNKIMVSLSVKKVSVSLCNNGNLSQFQFELKYCIISIICDIHKNYSMILKFCIEHSNIIAVLCAKFWNHGINNRLAVDSQDLSSREISSIAMSGSFRIPSLALSSTTHTGISYHSSGHKFHP